MTSAMVSLMRLMVLDMDGREVTLQALASERPLVACFLRHFG